MIIDSDAEETKETLDALGVPQSLHAALARQEAEKPADPLLLARLTRSCRANYLNTAAEVWLHSAYRQSVWGLMLFGDHDRTSMGVIPLDFLEEAEVDPWWEPQRLSHFRAQLDGELEYVPKIERHLKGKVLSTGHEVALAQMSRTYQYDLFVHFKWEETDTVADHGLKGLAGPISEIEGLVQEVAPHAWLRWEESGAQSELTADFILEFDHGSSAEETERHRASVYEDRRWLEDKLRAAGLLRRSQAN